MSKHIVWVCLVCVMAMACGGETSGPPGDASSDAIVVQDASPEAAPPCSLRIDSLSPREVQSRGGEVVVIRGCGFRGVIDVQINVMSVDYEVVDDREIRARTQEIWLDDPSQPYTAQVDVIRRTDDQAQTFLQVNGR